MLNNLLKAQLAAFLTAKLVQSPVFLNGVAALHAASHELKNVAYEALERATVDESVKPLPRQSPPPRSPTHRDSLRKSSSPQEPIFDPTAHRSPPSSSSTSSSSSPPYNSYDSSTTTASGNSGNSNSTNSRTKESSGRTAPPPNETEGERLLREFIEKTKRDVASRK